MVGKKLRLLLLTVGVFTLPISGVMADVDWMPTGDKVNSGGYAVASDGTYEEGDRIINTEALGEDGESDELRVPKKTVKSKRFKAAKKGKKKWATRGGEVEEEESDSSNLTNVQFNAAEGNTTLNIYGKLNKTGDACSLKLDGDITVQATGDVDGNVIIHNDVTLEPYVDPTSGDFTGEGYSQMYFNAAEGRTINVTVNGNLTFQGYTPGSRTRSLKSGKSVVTRGGEEEAGDNIDMIVTFAGKGKTVFKMADGTSVKFTGDIDGSAAVDVQDNNFFDNVANDAAGTKVFITMDNTAEQVNNGHNKVVFQRQNYAEENLRNMVLVGNNSIITYVSNDVTGQAHVDDATVGGYAAVAFDPSNQGTGRTVLFIQGAYTFGWESGEFTPDDPEYYQIRFKYPFNDGAVVVAGHKVAGYTPAQVRTTLNYSVPAGGQAFLRVTDDLQYANRDTAVAYAPTDAQTRGLLVVNDVQSVSKRAADPYWDYFNTSDEDDSSEELSLRSPKKGKAKKGLKKGVKRKWKRSPKRSMGAWRGGEEEGDATVYGYDWSYSRFVNEDVNTRNVRTGFVVGVNGVVDVNHNRFMDYVAGSVNQVDLLAANDYAGAVEDTDVHTLIKKKNPAALIVDGLDPALFQNDVSRFEAANPFTQANPRRAEIRLRGNGQLLMRASGSSKENVGYIFNFWKQADPEYQGLDILRSMSKKSKAKWKSLPKTRGGFEEEESEGSEVVNPLDLADLDWDAALAVGEGEFDGYRLAANDDTVQSGEGEHVLEVEGNGVVNSLANTSIIDPATGAARNYASTVANAGLVNMLSLVIDHMSEEVVDRPLTRGESYLRYNSPGMFLNNNLSVHNTQLLHDDVTKLVDGVPSSSEPAVTGGERLVFSEALFTFDGANDTDSQDRDRYRFPELRLYNASLDLGESLNASGLRLVVRDIPAGQAGSVGQAANNTSVVKFYDHGDAADTHFRGFGRMLMLGSHNNFMADGSTSNWVTEGAYVNVFKRNKPSTTTGDASATVKLSLQNGNQFPSSVAATEYDAQRAIHYFLLSGMEKGVANMALGWPTINGDSAASYPYANTYYENELLAEVASSTADDLFDLDGLVVPQATLSIDGHNIAFAGFNKDGKAVHGPITRGNNQGVIYVNHGGKITITRPEGDAFTSVPYETIIDTTIAQKVWNDYNNDGDARIAYRSGNVDLPHDQTTFAQNAAVQPYGLTQAMFDARAEETGGYVRLAFENAARPTADRSGAEDVVLNWFNREGDNDVLTTIASRFKGIKPSKKWQTRATELVKQPIEKPARLLYIGGGDDIAQLRVAGATSADPFMIDVSGDAVQASVGRIREFATAKRSLDMNVDHVVGEGAHAVLFLEYGGRIGLGSRDWNDHSVNPWNILGKDGVQIAPLGDGVIDLNSNLIVADSQALLGTTKFGADAGHRLTFYSENGYEVRVPAGVELDLSSFGQSANQQEIAFGGNARLVLEEGASIRFPHPDDVVGGVVLYFNDESELVFEGKIEPQVFSQPFNTSDAANKARIKILGKGQIWPNKNGKILVNGSVLVGVQSDDITPQTDVTISMNRQSEFLIGTENIAGGAFEVGNPAPVTGGSVRFALVNFGGTPRVHIDREGFLGLGAGVVDKHGNVNGGAEVANNPVLGADNKAQLGEDGLPVFTPDTTATSGWMIQPLHNVDQITVTLRSGSLEHNNIYDGSDANASLLAVGPAAAYRFDLNGQSQATVKGGGNLVLVPAGRSFKANVWDYAGALPGGERYSILASSPILLERAVDFEDSAEFRASGRSYTFDDQEDFFNLLTFKNYNDQVSKVAVAGAGVGSSRVGFINPDVLNAKYATTHDVITRRAGVVLANGRVSDVLAVGAVNGLETDEVGPLKFGAIAVQN